MKTSTRVLLGAVLLAAAGDVLAARPDGPAPIKGRVVEMPQTGRATPHAERVTQQAVVLHAITNSRPAVGMTDADFVQAFRVELGSALADPVRHTRDLGKLGIDPTYLSNAKW